MNVLHVFTNLPKITTRALILTASFIFILAFASFFFSHCSNKDSKDNAPTQQCLSGAITLGVPNLRGASDNASYPLLNPNLNNQLANITSQCYTKTDTSAGQFNPCYACHIETTKPNFNSDSELQESYAFPSYATTNRWTNLFVDRSAAVAAISDSSIDSYASTNNYSDANGKIYLAEKLSSTPRSWDFDADGKWSGYTPDCYYNFDTEGFDKDPSGNYTGWRAFGYYPFLGTFWPTNGSTDDVLIRLPEPFRQNSSGVFDKEIYRINLAIVEAMLKSKDIPIAETKESDFGIDLNGNGNTRDTVTVVTYRYQYESKRNLVYAGRAGFLQKDCGEIKMAPGLFPTGTEFLHSVRYVGTSTGAIQMGTRMKELRYGRKVSWKTYSDLQVTAQKKAKEKTANPDYMEVFAGNIEIGIINDQGWVYQGFIEDAAGDLRPQTYEENVFCIGCHTNLGATTDTVFSFPRKFDSASAFQKGWYHWSQKGLENIPEAKRASDGEYEYAYYLMQNKAGDEFRANSEVINKFFDGSGNPIASEFTALHGDVTHLLFPSIARARTLNKAYKVIVQNQSFIYGSDATVTPPANVHETVTQDQLTNVTVVPENRLQ